jgi:uncharacterized membrane protein YbhN (UPF0104 family)
VASDDREPGRALRLARTWLPWLLAIGVLVYLALSVQFSVLWDAVRRVSLVQLVLLLVAYVVALFLADSLGTLVALRRALPAHPLRYRQVVKVRGASYLFATLHYGAGQGAFAVLLQRHAGIPIAEVAGAVLLGMGANIVTVSAAAGAGVLVGGAPANQVLQLVLLALAAGLPAYLVVIALKPGFLTRIGFLAPLFRAGVRGHLLVAAARLPHISTLVLGHFAALRLFGVDIPPGEALVRLPLVFVVAVLPISPSGLGTVQAASVALLASFVAVPAGLPAEAASEARTATIFAYSLTMQAGAMLLQALMGLAFLALTSRQERRPSTS